MKTSDMIEARGAIVARMNEAHEADNNEAFTAAEAELRALDAKLDRQRKIDDAERVEPGRPIAGDGKLDSEIRSRFSIARAVAGAAGLGVDWAFEREVQSELATRAGRKPEGIFIPTEIFETRVTTGSTGADLISTDHRPDLYISALAAASVTRALGATVLNGLTGNLSIPAETDAPNAAWVADNSALSPSDPGFDAVTMAPKHVGAISEWSRNMVLQSSPDIEALLRRMLARDLALEIDRAAVSGLGTTEPLGIINAGCQTHAYATSLHLSAANAISKADVANVGLARRGFLASNGIKLAAMGTLDLENRPVPLSSIFHGEPIMFSNQALDPDDSPASDILLFGDWSELLIGIWSEIDILVNPFESTAYSKGNIQIRAMSTADVALRHAAAFVHVTGASASSVGVPQS